MKNVDVDVEAIAEVIAGLGGRFTTKDVSTDPKVVDAHPGCDGRELNAAVGRVLSTQRGNLGIEFLDAGPGNALWRCVAKGPV